MKHLAYMFGLLVLLGITLCGCSQGQRAQSDDLKTYFPEKVEAAGLQRGPEIRTFVGDSLWQYIDGGAELYHTYGFVCVLTAEYQGGNVDLVMDQYHFKTADGAYGLYSALRPDEPATVALGVEGYVTGTSLEFVRGNVMVRLIAFEQSEAVSSALRTLAEQVARSLPGTTDRPAIFARFPQEQAVAHSDKIVGASFLGQSFLNMVYTRDYLRGDRKLTLFLIPDSLGAVMAEWMLQSGDSARAAGSAVGLPYDENYSLMIANNYYGNVIAGLRSGLLAGAVNYSDQEHDFAAGWLNGLAR